MYFLSQLGWSGWSEGHIPVAPQSGVFLSEKTNLTECIPIATKDNFGATKITTTIQIQWFSPILSNNRIATSFEVQFCPLIGAMKKNVNFLSANSSKDPDLSEGLDFQNVRNDIKINELEIVGLKGGGKYQFRVRPQVDGVW